MFKDDLNVPLNAAQTGQKNQCRDIAACSDTNEVIDDDLRSLKSSEASLILKNKSLQVLGMLKLDRSHMCFKAVKRLQNMKSPFSISIPLDTICFIEAVKV